MKVNFSSVHNNSFSIIILSKQKTLIITYWLEIKEFTTDYVLDYNSQPSMIGSKWQLSLSNKDFQSFYI